MSPHAAGGKGGERTSTRSVTALCRGIYRGPPPWESAGPGVPPPLLRASRFPVPRNSAQGPAPLFPLLARGVLIPRPPCRRIGGPAMVGLPGSPQRAPTPRAFEALPVRSASQLSRAQFGQPRLSPAQEDNAIRDWFQELLETRSSWNQGESAQESTLTKMAFSRHCMRWGTWRRRQRHSRAFLLPGR